ncbi:MAG TPA: LytTR family DNA-binding domain-containing protein [Longimicrobium sp.]|nr:LytTR family DNA-binding domain-containing protein [Longimicrobium sp.]
MTHPPLRVVVVDDEPLARTGMRDLLARDPELEVVAQCADGREAVRAIGALRPDLVLLDVQMPEMDGFEVLREIGAERMPLVVFVTAYDRFALRAFDVAAVDYLLKPFDDERFLRAMQRAKHAVRNAEVGELGRRLAGLLERGGAEPAREAPAAYASRLMVKNTGRTVFVRVEEVDWIEADDYYAKLHVGDKTHLLRESMGSLEARLDPLRFFRVHRSAIVNLDRVREVQFLFRGEHVVILHDGTRLKLTRTRLEKLESILAGR